ncbi:MAG: MurR/RpiR family transcriptional regulator [Erysipelotrichaceae bacterium]|nr:MurR/RpiR family transcriptional regulator [Erysipelotrichaceae bacterium]
MSESNHSINRFNLLTSLLSIIDRNDEDNTDFIIAKYILDNREQFAKMSIYEVADNCFVSRSSIQRFIKNIGYDSFNEIKSALGEVSLHEKALLSYTDYNDYSDYLLKNINLMTKDIVNVSKSQGFKNLVEQFINANNVVILIAEDSAPSCKLFQQQLLALGKFVRIISSASKKISLLNSLDSNDLLLVCSVTGNFAIAINDTLKDLKAKKCLITSNHTAQFINNYFLIYYLAEDFEVSNSEISRLKNVYTTYGLSFFFDLFYHECYLYYLNR